VWIIVWIYEVILLRIPIYVDVTQLASIHIKEEEEEEEEEVGYIRINYCCKQNILAPSNLRRYPTSLLIIIVH
jgi:hypothetical protein